MSSWSPTCSHLPGMIKMFLSKQVEAVGGMIRLMLVSMITVLWFSWFIAASCTADEPLQIPTFSWYVWAERMHQLMLETKHIPAWAGLVSLWLVFSANAEKYIKRVWQCYNHAHVYIFSWICPLLMKVIRNWNSLCRVAQREDCGPSPAKVKIQTIQTQRYSHHYHKIQKYRQMPKKQEVGTKHQKQIPVQALYPSKNRHVQLLHQSKPNLTQQKHPTVLLSSPFQVKSGSTMCTAMVERRA